jgi:hypothetical protein
MKIVRKISTIALLLVVIAQITTIVLLEIDFYKPEVEELHEFCGFLFFGLVFIHLVIFRKSLKNMLSTKTQ